MMDFVRKLLLGTALVTVLASSAQAQGESGGQQLSSFQLMNNRVLVVTPDGRVIMRSGEGSPMLTDIMREARQMSAGTILLMKDEKLYSAPDRAMPDGTMLSGAIARLPVR